MQPENFNDFPQKLLYPTQGSAAALHLRLVRYVHDGPLKYGSDSDDKSVKGHPISIILKTVLTKNELHRKNALPFLKMSAQTK